MKSRFYLVGGVLVVAAMWALVWRAPGRVPSPRRPQPLYSVAGETVGNSFWLWAVRGHRAKATVLMGEGLARPISQ